MGLALPFTCFGELLDFRVVSGESATCPSGQAFKFAAKLNNKVAPKTQTPNFDFLGNMAGRNSYLA
jgi:hypothetical protein